MLSSLLLAALVAAPLACAQTCVLQFDGRISADFALADFDSANDFFDSASVFGQGTVPREPCYTRTRKRG